MALWRWFLHVFVLCAFIYETVGLNLNYTLPEDSYGDPKVRAFGKRIGQQMGAKDPNTFAEIGKWSLGKDGAGYKFGNGGKASVGGYGFKYRSKSGWKFYAGPTISLDNWKFYNGKPTFDIDGWNKEWQAGVKRNF